MPWLDAILAYIHFLSIIALVSTVVVEAFLCRPGLTLLWTQRLGRVDLLYLVTSILALSSGLLRMFFGAKGAAFYYNNPVFWVKIGLFIIVGLISIIPTMRFIRWAKRLQAGEGNGKIDDQEVNGTAAIIYLELGLLALIPLMGSLMARGFGYGW
jgi:putative membrane protein